MRPAKPHLPLGPVQSVKKVGSILTGHRQDVQVSTANDGRRPHLDRTLREVALSAFAERGYHGTSLRHVAARADVTVAAVWHHYRTKDALLAVVLDPVVTACAVEAARAERLGPHPDQRP